MVSGELPRRPITGSHVILGPFASMGQRPSQPPVPVRASLACVSRHLSRRLSEATTSAHRRRIGERMAWAAALAGCAHLPKYALPGPSPTASFTPSPSPSPSVSPSPSPSGSAPPCGQEAPGVAVLIVIAAVVTAVNNPQFGVINGYTTVNPDGTFGNVASVISARQTNIIQFVNGELNGPGTILHSAVGFPNATAFPTVPYSFPAESQTQIGNAISQSLWSAGRLARLCFSQAFTAAPGTYFFGDFDFCNLNNMRDVIVVQP